MTENTQIVPQYYEEDTVDLGELIRTYIKKWLPLSIVSVIVAGIVFLFLWQFYNKAQRDYVASFEYTFPGKSQSLYPNGTTFNYQDFVTDENILKAAKSLPSLAKLSDEEVLEKVSVGIERNYTTDKDNNKVYDGTYKLTVHKASVGNAENAKIFAEALFQGITDEITRQANEVYYHTYLDSYKKADTFETKLSYLKQQKDYISGKYDGWINSYSEQFAVNGMTLGNYRQSAILAMTDKVYDALNYEQQKRQYVYSRALDEELVTNLQIELLEDEMEDNEKKIQNLVSALEDLRKTENKGGSDLTGKSNEASYYEKIASLTTRQVDIERSIKNLNIKLDNMDSSDDIKTYAAKLDEVYQSLYDQALILEKTIAPVVYKEKTIYQFTEGFEQVGGFSSVVGGVAAFIVAYMIAGFFAFVMRNEKKEEKAAE